MYFAVHSVDGKVAYSLSRTYPGRSRGRTTITTSDSSSKKLFPLDTNNDICEVNTRWTQSEGPLARDNLPMREYKFDSSRAFSKFLWRFNYYSETAGARVYYKFEQNFSNKGGRIIKVAAGQPSQLVGLLRGQVRRDNWLDTVKGEKTFTLSCIDGAPLPELVTMLALAFLRCS
ncbi:uncharacterized protein PGTG_13175 [Puccinia graminis f. sp. tritici CRL 75-36-700-3]|uniref:Tubby C-terminal domain-containing protein n=2 Tax=Puccinia graminis f. sp. tritici TaxID=56615 RepID=E3KR68_PUCGT|nr:uncharacterized protein PGTG_13175 [Puccinia graminis f. sp. tritici CRL 75-36-700-3]EFP86793.1 hypothetical protein PGTG_13175 [Puccinia graminis f. sp. tritici CRL 75-36-700-3]